jgi:hypothetical protein
MTSFKREEQMDYETGRWVTKINDWLKSALLLTPCLICERTSSAFAFDTPFFCRNHFKNGSNASIFKLNLRLNLRLHHATLFNEEIFNNPAIYGNDQPKDDPSTVVERRHKGG